MTASWWSGLAAGLLVFALVAWVAWRSSRPRQRSSSGALPRHWTLKPRLYFSSLERRLYGWIKGGFPAHIVLIKPPVTRYTMPADRERADYWYGLIGPLYTTFALCEANGKVVAALDVVDRQRPSVSRRAQAIKRSALDACGIRYVVLEVGALPSLSQLRDLVLGDEPALEAATAVEGMAHARESLERKVRHRRADRERFADSQQETARSARGGNGRTAHAAVVSESAPDSGQFADSSRFPSSSRFPDSQSQKNGDTGWTWPSPLGERATIPAGLTDPSLPDGAVLKGHATSQPQERPQRHASSRSLRLQNTDTLLGADIRYPDLSHPPRTAAPPPQTRPLSTGHVDLEL